MTKFGYCDTGGTASCPQHFDSRGRLWRSRTIEDGNIASATNSLNSGIMVDMQHLLSSAGRCTIVSNPYRQADAGNNAATPGWKLTNFDGVGRPTTVWNFPGSAAPGCGESNTNATTGHSITTYNTPYALTQTTYGIKTEVTDEAGATRRMVSDALGRLALVIEDPSNLNYSTAYSYDTLDNLTGVTQDTQARTFSYDSLKRLHSSAQPEMTAAPTYTYTNDGLVATRTDGNGGVTTYTYDALNRLTGETHTGSAASATITRCYDGLVTSGDGACDSPSPAIPQAYGRLTESRSNLASEGIVSLTRYSAYDELGRILASQQTTSGSQPFVFQYAYDRAGQPTAITYPTGRTLTTVYDNAERPVSLSGAVNGGTARQYASEASYAPHGGLASMTVNPGTTQWTESRSYNSRLQATALSSAGITLGYDYGGTANNGNVMSSTVTRNGTTWSQNFFYDGVNRLCAAAEGAAVSTCTAPAPGVNWSQSYGYDRYGNRWVSGSPGYGLSTDTPVAATNFDGGNHLTISGVLYDAAGNQKQLGSGLTMAYDADGRMEKSTLNGLATTYAYDADGRRVMKKTGSTSVTYVYDAFGQLAMEAGGAQPAACTTCFVTQDPLGSTRETVSASGAAVGCHDYLPFGEELNGVAGRTGGCWGAGETTLRFTGKERDPETASSAMSTGLDYFGARYMSSAQGRFTSPDPVGGDLTNPQSLNRYTYVLNNPLRFTDPTGLYTCRDTKDGSCTSDQDVAFEKALDALRGKKGDVGRAAAAYGKAGDANGVTVGFADLTKKGEAGNVVSTIGTDATGANLRANSEVTIQTGLGGTKFTETIGQKAATSRTRRTS